MKKGLKFGLGLVVLFLVLMFSPTPVLADGVLTQFGGAELTVPAGHSTETVVAVDTDVRIAGTVTDVVLTVGGNVYLEPTAHVDLVISLGGHVYNSATRPAQTGIFAFNFTHTLLNQLFLGMALLFGAWFTKVILSLIAVILFTALGYLLRNHLAKAEDVLSVSALRLFGAGTGSALVIVCLAVLLSLTVIGIPIAVFLLIVTVAAVILGLVPLIDYWGSKILAQWVQGSPSLTKWLIQALFFTALLNLPLIGLIFFFIAGIIGLGLTLTLAIMYVKDRGTKIANP